MSDEREQAITVVNHAQPRTSAQIVAALFDGPEPKAIWPSVVQAQSDELDALRDENQTAQAIVVGSIRLADIVWKLVAAGKLDSRSPAGDAVLDLKQQLDEYRKAGFAPRAFALAAADDVQARPPAPLSDEAGERP